MPTLLDKVDQFWRGVGDHNTTSRSSINGGRGTTTAAAPRLNASSITSRSRPPLPPSSSSSSSSTKSRIPFSPANSNNSSNMNSTRVTGRPPVPTSVNNGKFDRNRRCYSSLALNNSSSGGSNNNLGGGGVNSAVGGGGAGNGNLKKVSKNKLGSMGGSIVDIYEFCKAQASRRFNYHPHFGRLSKSISKSSNNVFSGSTMNVNLCPTIPAYPCIQEENERKPEKQISSAEERSSNSSSRSAINNAPHCHANECNDPQLKNRKTSSFDESRSPLEKVEIDPERINRLCRRAVSEGPSASSIPDFDQWVRDGLAFERLNDHENPCPEEQKARIVEKSEEQGESEDGELSEEAIKMRWHKLGSSSSSSTSSSSFSDNRRPKSFDYAQRKAWMKLYRDMEVSQASPHHPRVSRGLSKGSITHLHLQEVPSEQTNSISNLDEVGEACGCDYDTGMMRSSDISSTSPSLFKRFSKTFSLRFGSGSNVSKNTGDVHQHHRKGSKSKGAIGSSPDLFNRVEVEGSRDKVNGKMRKTNVKSVRGDKCQSGDSGIQVEDEQEHEQQMEQRHVSNLRRIRSDYISPSMAAAAAAANVGSQSNPSYASRHLTNSSTSTLAKLSLVEIPDHSWDEHNSGGGSSPNEGSGSHTSDTTSYEELVDAKLDGDDGFSSSDEGHNSEQALENPSYYHSLPHRKHKRRLKETESTNSCGETPQEDNSIRGKVVREIIHTEQNYVKTLNDIVQGFLNPCRARNDLFSSRTVQNIFSNIEEILRLHVKFLEALKSKVDPTFVSKSNVGAVFTSWADKFSLYSEYCCNNPISVATVRSLVQFSQYAEFFEACRRLQMMDKLPLHGFLLRPIQRICQYHLQLNELLKHTEESHTDHPYVVEALETMKSVATKINDTQRQFESLQEIIRLQHSIDGWEGPNLVDRNAVILRKGELVKVTHGRKQKEVFVAVLNKDLIYCKKDFMKKSGYVFDGRIDLNLRMWINIDSNEEDEFFGMVHNSWRIYSPERRAWILFTAPSPTEKRKWISALEKTKEDIQIDPKLREMAVVTTALTDAEMMSNGNSHGHHSNTLPKSKKSKGKHLTVTKVDSDAMLIEVGKLKRSTVYQSSSNSKEGTSKFYV